MAINKKWHEEHKMPEKATIEQKIAWHCEHVKYCTCHPMPAKIVEEIEKRKKATK
jgi:hypothetical protein